MSTQFPFRVSRWPRWLVIYKFCLAYMSIILSYIHGYIFGEIEMRFLIISIIFFWRGCHPLLDELSTVIEPRLSRRASIALVTIGLCLYAPLPFLVLQGYRLNPQHLRDPLVEPVFAVLILASLLLIYGVNRYYKKSLVTETQRT